MRVSETDQTKTPRTPAQSTWVQGFSRHNEWIILFSVLLAVGIWSAVVHWSDLPEFVLPAPISVWRKFLDVLLDGSLLFNTWVTFKEVMAGLLSGSCLAICIGYFLSRSSTLEKLISPILVAGQAVPTVAIAPILIIWFGSGISSKVLICALTVFFPILINTIIGFRSTPVLLRDLMHSMHASRWQVFKLLEVPASLPILLGGLRIGATLSVIGAVVGEFVGSDQGLGFLINLGRGQYDMALVFVAILTLMMLALGLYGLVVLSEYISMPWKRNR